MSVDVYEEEKPIVNVLSIDPGVACCGWTEWEGKHLASCGLSRTKNKDIESRVRDHDFQLHWPQGKVDLIVMEKPEIYQQRFWKGDPRDLIDLAMVVGGIIRAATQRVKTVFPKEWKGQVPKEVTEARVLEALTEEEVKIVQNPTVFGEPPSVPPSLRHNMFDALGIGMWFLKR